MLKRPPPPIGNPEVADFEDRVERLAREVEPCRALVGERDVDHGLGMMLPQRAAEDPHLRQIVDRSAGEDVQGVRHRHPVYAGAVSRAASSSWKPIIVASAVAASTAVQRRPRSYSRSRSAG